jgi:hypothetical protein
MKTTTYHPIFGEVEVTKRVPDSPKIRSRKRDKKKREESRKNIYAGVDILAATEALYCGRIRPEQAAAISGDDLAHARKMLRWVQIEHGIGVCPHYPPPELPPVDKLKVPEHELREDHLPELRARIIDERLPDVQSDEELQERFHFFVQKGATAHQLVDFMNHATGGSWQECREVVRAVLGQPDAVSDDQLVWLERARKFWRAVRMFGRYFRNAVAARHIRPAFGRWLFVPEEGLSCFLPGLQVPKMHKRVEYLIRVHHAETERLVNLDFYSTDFLPLFRATV